MRFGVDGCGQKPVEEPVAVNGHPAGAAANGHQNRTMYEVERDHILKTLESCGQNRTQAAKLLDINIRTLRNKLNEYKVKAGESPEPSLAAENDVGLDINADPVEAEQELAGH